MRTIEVFTPRLCSAAYVHRDDEPEGCRLAADLEWLAAHDVAVVTSTFADQPGRFVEHDAVRFLMNVLGTEALPLVLVDGVIRSHGAYPDREQLAEWVGLEAELEQDAAEGAFLHGGEDLRLVLAEADAALESVTRSEVLASLATWSGSVTPSDGRQDDRVAAAG